MYKRNKDGVVLEWDNDLKSYVPRKASKKYFELSKRRRKMAKKSER